MQSEPSRTGTGGGADREGAGETSGGSPPRAAGGRTAPRRLRLAALDIGTHATKLLVAEVATMPGGIGFQPLARLGKVTRLGAGSGPGRPIAPDAAARATDASRELLGHAHELGVQRVIAAGTGILRRAPNGRAIAQGIAHSLHLEVPVLEPQVEAALSFLGLRAGLGLDPPMVAVDVGGGTTELIELGQRGLSVCSLDLGCLDLTERYLRGAAPHAEAALGQLDRVLHGAAPGPLASDPRSVWAAVGGTVSALAALDLGIDHHDPDQTHGHRLTRPALERIVRRELGHAGRNGSIVGIGPAGVEREQGDVLLAGAAILLHLLRIHRVTSVLASSWGLRQGLLLSAVLAPEERAGRDPRRSGAGAFALAAGPRPEMVAASGEGEP